MLSLPILNSFPAINNYYSCRKHFCRNGCFFKNSNFSLSFTHKANVNVCHVSGSGSGSGSESFQGSTSLDVDDDKEHEEEDYQVLTAMTTMYNNIVILETTKARILLLDSTNNVHSILNKNGNKWTGSYWDEFASLPAIIPEGPIAIFGLGGGTVAHLMLDLWPSLQIDGWEIDEILIHKARQHFGLSDLEKQTQAGGILNVHIGDALSPSGCERYAGIVIDLFSEGKVLAQLQEIATWLELNNRLMPGGRIMVNCGGSTEEPDNINGSNLPKSVDYTWAENSTIRVLSKAFPGQVCWKRMAESQGANFLALTGPIPDFTSWAAMVPDTLNGAVQQWKPCVPLQ